MTLLSKGFSVFAFDFAGSGLSEGEYCTLGYHEQDDLRCVIEYLRQSPQIDKIAVWGRSMGAASTLMVAADQDSGIDAIVLDSCFLSLESVCVEVADRYVKKACWMGNLLPVVGPTQGLKDLGKSWLPSAIDMLRSGLKNRANFDIAEVRPEEACHSANTPAFFAHALEDELISCSHSIALHDRYQGRKVIRTFSGDHNSQRPKEFVKEVIEFLSQELFEHPELPPRRCRSPAATCCEMKVQGDGLLNHHRFYLILVGICALLALGWSNSQRSALILALY
mmetsp:Transcript_1622/g.2640  ORF Transcript_1622/g.2640 Transcript_1622/m.2640 type:complete len:280 (-) Transcript_1622:117-956(-)